MMRLSADKGPTAVALLEETIPQNLARTVAEHGERDALVIDKAWNRVPTSRAVYMRTGDWDEMLAAADAVSLTQLEERTAGLAPPAWPISTCRRFAPGSWPARRAPSR